MSRASVTPLCCGSITMDASALTPARAGEEIEAPSLVFLIETGDEALLVDTSFGDPSLMEERHPGFEVHRDPDHTLPAVLERAGYAPAELDAVILSHLDWDHCHGLDRFEGPVYVQRREVAYAAAPYPMHADRYDASTPGRDPPWLHPGLTPVDGETDLAPGVTAFPTPGHTVGHQSVAVETDAGTTVVAVDAVPTRGNLPGEEDDGMTLGSAMDDFDWWESAREIRDRADRVLPGHEWDLVPERPGEVG